MALKVIVDQDQQPSGVFIPLEDWEQLNTTIKPYTPIYELMEELTVPEKIRDIKQNFVLPSGLTIQEAENISSKNVEEIYIKAFAQGLSRYYKDERCLQPKNMIKANPDGSEDLVDFDWQTRDETLVNRLAPAGKGKFAYLVHDPRYAAFMKA